MTAMRPARRRMLGRAAHAVPADEPHLIRVVIPPDDPNAPPPPRVPSSREIARRRAKAEAAARDAAAARALSAHVQAGMRSPPGRLFVVDKAALVLRGPLGGIGASARALSALEPLAAGGRHDPAALVKAGGWPDEATLREFLAGLGGRLAAIGLRIDSRKVGLRIARAG